VNVSARLQQSCYNRRIRTRCPGRNDIASEELRHARNRNDIFQTDRFTCQRPALGITPDEKSVCPGLTKSLFFFTWSAYILPWVLGLIRDWFIVWQCGYTFGAVMNCCEKGVEILRLGWVDG
jgi:hypothetical protein